jgi:hypothetical protein
MPVAAIEQPQRLVDADFAVGYCSEHCDLGPVGCRLQPFSDTA